MKRTKKILALGLVVAMLLGMTLTANAAVSCKYCGGPTKQGPYVTSCSKGDYAFAWQCTKCGSVTVACLYGHQP